MFNATFQCFNLSVKPNGFAVVGFLGLVDSANSFTQYSPESGGIKVGNIPKEGVQGAEGDGDWRGSWRVEVRCLAFQDHGIVAIIFTVGVGEALGRHNCWVNLGDREWWEGMVIFLTVADCPFLYSVRFI